MTWWSAAGSMPSSAMPTAAGTWWTGRPAAVRRRPQLKTKAVQLAVYRLAWARLKGVPLDQVRAAFYYVADNQVVRPHDLGSAERLEQIVAAALGKG